MLRDRQHDFFDCRDPMLGMLGQFAVQAKELLGHLLARKRPKKCAKTAREDDRRNGSCDLGVAGRKWQ
jgi:hypothetical protein